MRSPLGGMDPSVTTSPFCPSIDAGLNRQKSMSRIPSSNHFLRSNDTWATLMEILKFEVFLPSTVLDVEPPPWAPSFREPQPKPPPASHLRLLVSRELDSLDTANEKSCQPAWLVANEPG